MTIYGAARYAEGFVPSKTKEKKKIEKEKKKQLEEPGYLRIPGIWFSGEGREKERNPQDVVPPGGRNFVSLLVFEGKKQDSRESVRYGMGR